MRPNGSGLRVSVGTFRVVRNPETRNHRHIVMFVCKQL